MPRFAPAFAALLTSAAALQTAAQIHVFVDDDAPPGGDGLTWATALNDLRDAVALSESLGPGRGEVRIAGGSYLGDGEGPLRIEAFGSDQNEVTLLGGFAGFERPNSPDDRDLTLFSTRIESGATAPTIEVFGGGEAGSSHSPISAIDMGSAITLALGVAFSGLKFADNQAITVNAIPDTLVIVESCEFFGCGSEGSGGAIRVSPASLIIKGSNFELCKAALSGGAIFHEGPELIVIDTMFRLNVARSGGAIASFADDASVTNTTMFANGATDDPMGQGGAIKWAGDGAFRVLSSTFQKNSAAFGGAIHIDGESTIASSQFLSNFAGGSGGAVAFRADSDVFSLITNCLFDTNTALENGGALWCDEMSQPISIFASEFTENEAVLDGGAMYSSRPSLIFDSRFESNAGGNGGALYFSTASEIRDSVFLMNRGGDGGAIYGPADVHGSTFTQNESLGSGGALHTPTRVSQTDFFENTAVFNGGAIFSVDSVVGGTFVGNSADFFGGAIVRLGMGVDLVMTDNSAVLGAAIANLEGVLRTSLVADNVAVPQIAAGARSIEMGSNAVLDRCIVVGGSDSTRPAIFTKDQSGNVTIIDSLVVGGVDQGVGSDLDIVGSTLIGNQVDGVVVPALRVAEGAVGFVDSSALSSSVPVEIEANAGLIVVQSLIPGGQEAIEGVTPDNFAVLGQIIDADPRFVDPLGPDGLAATWEDNDYRPAPGSPLIDSGSGFNVSSQRDDDLNGNDRVRDDPTVINTSIGIAPIDIGAFEFQGISCPADVNRDGVLSPEDFTAWLAAYNAGSLLADLTLDGTVTPDDFTAWLAAYNMGCP